MREEKEGRGRRLILAMTKPSLSWIEEVLWPRGEMRDIWMIADAARDRAVFRTLLECGLEYSCLYSGPIPPALEIAAPYLIQLEYQDRYTRRFLENACGNSWGILLKCGRRMADLRRHLRQFLVVRDPRGQRLVFRYYDPRVLRVYLPTCVEDELQTFFGPVECFWAGTQTAENILEYHCDSRRLVQETLTSAVRAPDRRPAFDGEMRTQRRTGLMGLRQAQLAAFSQREVQKFEDWMVVHLEKFFARKCKSMGEAQLRAMIQYGIKRAAAHRITSERDVCKYIDLMLVFGRDFDVDERHPWARETLQTRGNAESRISSLYQSAERQLRGV